MSQLSSSTKWASWLGVALIGLVLYALLAAIVLIASWIMLQRGVTPDWPWIAPLQKNLYMKGARSIWQTKPDCVEFDHRLIYKPKHGKCVFENPEFKTTLNFSSEGRYTGSKPSGIGIAVLGDSHAMGWGVDDEETFSAILQQLSGRPVYNLAVSSYGTLRELERLRDSGLSDKIDTIIIQYCDNDLEENLQGFLKSPDDNLNTFNKIMSTRENSASLSKFIINAYKYSLNIPLKFIRHKSEKKLNNFPPHHNALINLMKRYSDLERKNVIVFYSNAHGKRFNGFQAGQSKDLPYIHFLDINLDRSDYFRIDDHLTPTGHRKIAQQLLPVLGKRIQEEQ